MRWSRPPAWLPYALVASVVVAVYGGSLSNGPVWDDADLVTENPFLRSPQGFVDLFTHDLWTASAQAEPSAFYRPLTMATFALNRWLGGSVASFRLGNVLIHALNAALFARLVARCARLSGLVAGLVALLWALAPVCSEPVLWISGRFDLLAMTFALLALSANGLPGRARPLAVGLACLAGLFTKESFIAWTPVLLLDDVALRARPARGVWTLAAAVAAASGLYLLTRGAVGTPSASVLAEAGIWTMLESGAFLSVTFIGQLLAPTRLDPFRPYAPLSTGATWLVLVLLAAVTGALAALVVRRKGAPHAAVGLLGLLWFLLGTAPTTLVGPSLLMIGDRYAYLPLAGLLLSLAALVAWSASRAALPAHAPQAGVLLVGLACAADVWGVERRFPDWRDDESLARSSLRSNPGNPYSTFSLGSALAERGELGAAEALLLASAAREPRVFRVWNALCFTHLRQGRLVEAEADCRKTLAINGDNPRAWVNLASVYVNAGKWAQALASAERAVSLKPGYAEAHYLAAVSAANLGRMDVAHEALRIGRKLDPNHRGLLSLEAQMKRRGPPSP